MTREEIEHIIDEKEKLSRSFFRAYAKKNSIYRFNEQANDCSFDFSLISGTTKFIAEVKLRLNSTVEEEIARGPFLERTKFDGMKKEAIRIKNKYGIDPTLIYLSFAQNGCVIYQLKELYDWQMRNLPTSQWDKNKILKAVVPLTNPLEVINYKLKIDL